MWTTVDTTAALVRARNDRLSLTALKKGNTSAAAEKTGQLLETLGAVVPTGVTAAYTTVAVAVHQFVVAAERPDRRCTFGVSC